jgi:hypothetical protein
MTKDALASRLEALEKQVAELSAQVRTINNQPDWHTAVGMFAGDDFMRKIFEEGRKIREAERKRARPNKKKK